MKRSFALVPAIVGAALLAGCVNGYAKFYRSYNGATPQRISQIRAAPPARSPVLDHYAGDVKTMFDRYESAGYMPIGYSSFNSGHNETDAEALTQAKKVGADLVVVMSPKYTGTTSTVLPLVTPTTSTSYTSGTATAYGSNGQSATAYGSATTTTYGSRTTYIPINTRRYDYGAVYFVRFKYRLGVLYGPLTNALRQRLGTNRALPIRLVVYNSPAFNADILPGDVITSIDGRPATAETMKEAAKVDAGGPLTLTLVREGKKIEKTVVIK